MISTILLGGSVLALSISCIFLARSLRLLQKQISDLRSELSAHRLSNFDDFSRLVKLECDFKTHTFLHDCNFFKTDEHYGKS